jgi:hypothetical protein
VQFIPAVAHVVNVVIFADQHAVAVVFIENGAQFLHQLMYAGLSPLVLEHVAPVFAPEFFLFGRLRQFGEAAQFCQSHRDVVRREIRVFVDRADGIEAEAVHAEVEPEADRVPHGLLHFGIMPVQVRLLLHEVVIVILIPFRDIGPGFAVEAGLPVVGRGVRPDVPIGFGIIAAGFGFDEPGMFVRCMIQHQVQNDAHVPFVRLEQEVIEILHAAVFGATPQ